MRPPSCSVVMLHFAQSRVQRYPSMDNHTARFYFSCMDDGWTWDDELDAAGLLCPLPVLKARKRLKAMPVGAVLRLIATDPAAVVDVPHYCAEAGHGLIGVHDAAGQQVYLIRKGG